jgi:hypothetical protein
MALKKTDLKALISTPLAGFKNQVVTVEEWGGVKVIIREPSAAGWVRFSEIVGPQEPNDGGEPAKLSRIEETQRNIQADVVLFIDCLFDEDGNQVYSQSDLEMISAIYGPIHRSLLEKALALQTKKEDAEAK